MIPLASALQEEGHKVTYIAEERMTVDRKNMGWEESDNVNVEIIIIKNKNHINTLIRGFSADTVHCVQGVYANGYMEKVRRSLKHHGVRWGAIMEMVDERSWYWPIKRIVYRRYLSRWAARPDFVLAIGAKTKDWVKDRGFSPKNTFPFTYFIDVHSDKKTDSSLTNDLFRIGFAGQLIPLKRVDLLIEALSGLADQKFELIIIGDGPLYNVLKYQAIEKLNSNRFSMLGQLKMEKVPSVMKSLDCFVLPSDYDGWGVVVTEALMAGIPVICSDACGAAEAVIASGVGGVFPKGDIVALRYLLKENVLKGVISPDESNQLSHWAKCFGNKAGANYFSEIINFVYNGSEKPVPPWFKNIMLKK
jgi:glycosyltransferase involved in cell wall biosynthesis